MSEDITRKKIALSANFNAATRPYREDADLYKHTNCYSYALGLPELGCAIPGHLAKRDGRLYNYMARADYLHQLFQDDGLIKIDHDAFSSAETQIIGVAVKEYFNAHVLKYHQDGTWSHQDGFGQPISNTDSDGKIITDLHNANLGFYDEFVAYFKVPARGIAYLNQLKPFA